MKLYTRTYNSKTLDSIKEISCDLDYSYCFYINYNYHDATIPHEHVRGCRKPYMYKGRVVDITVSLEDRVKREIQYKNQRYSFVYYTSVFNSLNELLQHIQVELSTEDRETIDRYLLESLL